MVVDDDPNIALLIEMTLARDHKYTTVVASDGQEALNKVEESLPDLILLDVMMPGMDGFEVIKQLKLNERSKYIPVIFLTAKSEIEDKLKGIDLGASDYITKPFNPEELLARVDSQMRIRELEEELATKKELEALLKLSVTFQHEVNNPLTGIIGNLELFEDWRTYDPAEVDRSIAEMHRLALRIKDIVISMGNITKVVSKEYLPGNEMIDLEQSSFTLGDQDEEN